MIKCRRSVLYAVVLITLAIIQGCKGLQEVKITGADGFEYHGMKNNSLEFAANIGVMNPSGVGFRITEVNLKAIVDGNFLGTLSTNDRVRIPAHSDSSYRMNFNLTMNNLLSGASALYGLSRKKQVNVEMQGFVKARAGITMKKVEVNESRIFDVPAFGR
jgi:LEA14-like dessication related protein